MGAVQLHLTNLQKEILKLYSKNIKDEELIEIKKIIGDFFSKKAIDEADKIWNEKNYSDDDMDKWLDD